MSDKNKIGWLGVAGEDLSRGDIVTVTINKKGDCIIMLAKVGDESLALAEKNKE